MILSSKYIAFMCILFSLCLLAGAVFASPSGLNNIPTADVTSPNVLVLQGYTVFGSGFAPTWFAGAKYGLAENLEVGIDGRIDGPGPSTDPALQLKYRLPLDAQTAVAGGIANITGDRSRNGETFPYLVISHDFGPARGHLGYSFQNDNQALFAGVDKALEGGLTLRADWIQVNDGDESLASIGAMQVINEHWVAEAWATFPSADGAKTSYVAKINYVIPMK